MIKRVIWLDFRFNLSLREIEELMAERGVDDEGSVLDIIVQSRRNKKTAMRLLRKLLKNNGVKPDRIVTVDWVLTGRHLKS